MSEFEKWWNKEKDNCEYPFKTAHLAWMTVLNWILQKNHIAKTQDGERFVFVDFIEQELEEIKNEN